MITDKRIAWKYRRIFLSAMWAGMIETAGAISLIGIGSPIFAAGEASVGAGVLLDTAGDSISHMLPIPWDMDTSSPFKARVHWLCANEEAAGKGMTFKVHYQFLASGEIVKVFAGAVDETLTFDESVKVQGAGAEYIHTDWETAANQNKIASSDTFLNISTECDAIDAEITGGIVLGTEIEYVAQATHPSQHRQL